MKDGPGGSLGMDSGIEKDGILKGCAIWNRYCRHEPLWSGIGVTVQDESMNFDGRWALQVSNSMVDD